MPLPTFTWFPDVGSRELSKPDVTVTRYGDGYESRLANGINSNRPVWSLKFTCTNSEAEAILAFLQARNAEEAFNWTNPRNVAGVYVCRTWSMTRMQGGAMEVSADFERVFEQST